MYFQNLFLLMSSRVLVYGFIYECFNENKALLSNHVNIQKFDLSDSCTNIL